MVVPSSSPAAIFPNTQCLAVAAVLPIFAGPYKAVQPSGVEGPVAVPVYITWAIRISPAAITAGQTTSNEAALVSVPLPAPADEYTIAILNKKPPY